MLPKNVIKKKCAPKLVFFNEKKMRKIWMIFGIENWLWKSNFGTFDTSPLTQFSKFNNFLRVCWFLGKNLSNFAPPVWKLHNPYCHNVHKKIHKKTRGKYIATAQFGDILKEFSCLFLSLLSWKECSFWHDFNPLWIESFAEVKSEKTGGSCLNLENSLKIHTSY